jgi:quinoprotein glucose dehydrogenase
MRHVRPTLALAALTAVGALALATAAPGQPAPTAPPAPAPDAAAPTPDAAAPDPALTLIQTKCTTCHDTGPILQGHHTAVEWKDVVGEMITNGAVLTPPESDQIVAYLAKTQPAAPPAS